MTGAYTAVLSYGGKTMRQPLQVALDPRLHPDAGALDARLALASRISTTLDSLNRGVNAALAARSRFSPAQRARLDDVVNDTVQFDISSSEGDLLHSLRVRDFLAFLMNSLDLACDHHAIRVNAHAGPTEIILETFVSSMV